MVRANFWDEGAFVVVENQTNRVVADSDGPTFNQVNLMHRRDPSQPWVEVTAWCDDEWRTSGNEAFEAILGAIAMVAAGVEVTLNTASSPHMEH